jgi:hypothetical protein
MRNLFKSAVFFLILFASFFSLHAAPLVLASSDSTGPTLHLLVSSCNNNSICEISYGEDTTSCPLDCPASTSTPPTPTPTPPSGSVGYSPSLSFVFENVKVVVTDSTAIISWHTKPLTYTVISWGLNADGGLGTITETLYEYDHSVTLDHLSPGTSYAFTLKAKSKEGAESSVTYSFKTETLTDTTPPGNATDFKATEFDRGINLTWSNPKDSDFAGVKITRGTRFFPRDPDEGYIVYEGGGNVFLDTSVKPGYVYYYSLFTKDHNGNYSEGTVASSPFKISTTNPPPPPLYNNDKPHEQINVPITIEQNDTILMPDDGVTMIQKDLGIVIYVPATAVPADTEQVLVTIQQKGVSSTFLLKKRKDGSYDVTIPPFLRDLDTPIPFSIDFLSRSKTGAYPGIFLIPSTVSSSGKPVSREDRQTYLWLLLILLLITLICLAVLLYRIIKRKK